MPFYFLDCTFGVYCTACAAVAAAIFISFCGVYMCCNRWMVNGSPSSSQFTYGVSVSRRLYSTVSSVSCLILHVLYCRTHEMQRMNWTNERSDRQRKRNRKRDREILKIETGKWNTETLNLNSISHPFKPSQSTHTRTYTFCITMLGVCGTVTPHALCWQYIYFRTTKLGFCV